MTTKYKTFKKRQSREEKQFVRTELAAHGWRLNETARALDMAPTSLVTAIRRLGLHAEYRARSPSKRRQ